jgi:uncharacterized protein YbjT (DUF2867 family)
LEGRDWNSHPHVEIRKTDLADPPTLAHGLSGCDAAFYLVHSMISAERKYAERDLALAHVFARAALDAGVRRIIYLGGLGETGPGLSEHLSSRREVELALGSAGVPVTVLRAAMIIGSGSASFEILRYLVHRLPVMITPMWVSTRCQPIAVENVLTYLVGVLAEPESIGGVYDIGGSETLCYRDIMRIMAEELGLPPRRIIAVPVLTPRLSSYWIHLVTPLSNKIARPLAEGLKNEVVCREDRITQIIPQKLLNVREAIRSAIGQVESHLVETSWRARCRAIRTGPAARCFATNAKWLSPLPRGLCFGPCAGLAASVAGMPIGFGRFAAGSIDWWEDQAFAAAEGIPIRSGTEILSISGEWSASIRVAPFPCGRKCVCPARPFSISGSERMGR